MADELDWSQLPTLRAHWQASGDEASLLYQLGIAVIQPDAEACASEWHEVGHALAVFIEAAAAGVAGCAAAAWAYYNAMSTLDQSLRDNGLPAVDELVLNEVYAEAQRIQQVADGAA
jgi:hypothetical protein